MKDRLIGLEYEFLAIQTANGQAVTREIVKKIWLEWSKEKHIRLSVDDATRQPIGVFYCQSDGQEVYINTDAGINIVEFGFLPFKTLAECEANMHGIITEFLHVAGRFGVALLAYGLQPKTPWYFPDMRSEKIWYRGFFRFPQMAARHTMFTNIAANQPCIDVTQEEAIRVINVFNALGGVFIALFANTGAGEWKLQEHHEEREWRWNQWLGTEPIENPIAGIPPRPFASLKDYLTYNWSVPTRAVHRPGTLHSIEELPLIRDFLRKKKWKTMDLATATPSSVSPETEDVNALNMYIWIQSRLKLFFDATQPLEQLLEAYDSDSMDEYAARYLQKMYVETRNIACQPWGEIMAAPAFLLGLIENLDETENIARTKSWQDWIELREETIGQSMSVPGVSKVVSQCLDISTKGLQKRNLGEEKYLLPLYERIRKGESPAIRAQKLFQEEGVEGIIQENRIPLNS